LLISHSLDPSDYHDCALLETPSQNRCLHEIVVARAAAQLRLK
jgi:hypothetical protein